MNPYFNFSCGGKWVRDICIFGYKDLPMLTHRVELFANKFHWQYQSITLDCMQEWYRNQVKMEVKNPNKMWINETYYKNIPYLKDTIKLST
ncbi:hypothetical protein LOTGIDRAFT_132178 [Lottia gigantea]|uniref:Uncharacterized protein n=1 Tax=Lottia gigantea TaxID=225164 RepID=V3ZJP2_LOTGI|nr:hypothetical protein LOTGIDRAFT_132178 [Lottia gigantea]ESO84452.1 hypothetical protein LOTGIDRAFT_132178 [Lottia gigantea]